MKRKPILEGVEDLSAEDQIEIDTPIPEPNWTKLTRKLVDKSCAFFAQEILTADMIPPFNGKFFVAEHHERWDELITQHKRVCVLAARDHGKSYFFNFAYPLWKAVTMPGGKGFILSATAPQVERILEDIILEVESNPKLQWLMPAKTKTRKWSSKYVRFANGHRIYARGYTTKVRGFHPNYIVCDDVLDDNTAYSETIRSRDIDYFYNAITNMIVPGGQIIVVGTPFSHRDLYGDLKKNPEYAYQEFPATPEKPLWPERYPAERLAAKKREIGAIRYTREFMVNPISDDMSIFPENLFKGDPVEQFQVKLGMPVDYWKKMGVTIFQGVDFAMSSNVGADYSVIWTMGIDDQKNRWIIDIFRKKGMPYQDQLSQINYLGKKYEPALIHVEDNQMQRIFGDELIRLTDLPIKKFTTTAQKNTLDKGIPALRVMLENKKFRIPRGGKKTNELIDQWIYEMHGFTFAQGKMLSTAEHDDLAMACWLCEQAINSVGFDFSFGDEELAEISEEKDQLGINPKNKSELEPEELLQELLNQNKIKRPVPKNYDLAELVDESEYWSD